MEVIWALESVREQGVLVPILVRKLEEERYEIIAGDRRKLAKVREQLKTIFA